METKDFSIGEALRFGWTIVKKNFGFFLAICVTFVLISFVPQNIANRVSEDFPALSIIFIIISWVVDCVLWMSMVRISLKFYDDKKADWEDFPACFPLFFKYIIGEILYTLIVFGGMFLLIVPGIYWGIKFQFFRWFIIDKGLSPIEALSASAEITRGKILELFAFNLVMMLIVFLGVLALLVGLVIAFPLMMVATAFVYRKLLPHEEYSQMSESLRDVLSTPNQQSLEEE